MNEYIAKAQMDDANEIFAIYASLIGTDGCTWSEDYPILEDVIENIREQTLYAVRTDDGEIIAAANIGQDEELRDITCWSDEIKNPGALARIGVKANYQNRGVAGRLIRYIENAAAMSGFDGIHFLAGRRNYKAIRLYEGLDYVRAGEATLFDIDWYCYEKRLVII